MLLASYAVLVGGETTQKTELGDKAEQRWPLRKSLQVLRLPLLLSM